MTLVHGRECAFYTAFGKLGLIPLPDIYYQQELDIDTRANGFIVMQDFTECAYMERIEDGMSILKVENMVKHLAHLHAYIICLGRDKADALLKPFRPDFLSDKEKMKEEDLEMFNKIMQGTIDAVPAVEPYLRRMKKISVGSDFSKWASCDFAKEHGLPEVLVHSDLWTNNLLWRKDKKNECAALIDWQCCFAGGPMNDIARLIVSCCEPEVRRHLDSYILQLYHDELSRLEAEKGGDTLKFTVEDDLRPVYEIAFVHQTTPFAMLVPLLTIVSNR